MRMTVYLFYIDESGDPGVPWQPSKLAGASPHYALSALGVSVSGWQDYLSRFLAMRQTLHTMYGFLLLPHSSSPFTTVSS